MPKMKPDDPAYWMLSDGVETTPVVYSPTCYICNDPEFAQMGLPLCRKCPYCGGHVAADDSICDNCGCNEMIYYEMQQGSISVPKIVTLVLRQLSNLLRTHYEAQGMGIESQFFENFAKRIDKEFAERDNERNSENAPC